MTLALNSLTLRHILSVALDDDQSAVSDRDRIIQMKRTGLCYFSAVDHHAVMRTDVLNAPFTAGKRQKRMKARYFVIRKLDICRRMPADQNLRSTQRINFTGAGKHISPALFRPAAVTAPAFSARGDQNHKRTDINKNHNESCRCFPKERIPFKKRCKIHIGFSHTFLFYIVFAPVLSNEYTIKAADCQAAAKRKIMQKNKGNSHARVPPYFVFNFDVTESAYINASHEHLCGNCFTFTGMRSGVSKLTAIIRAAECRCTE